MPPGISDPPGRLARGGNCPSVHHQYGKRPHPQFLLRDLPQPREAVRLDDQEEDDQRADDHELQVLDGAPS